MKAMMAVLLGVALAGCASEFKPGMKTTLSPGQSMLIRAEGDSPVLHVANKGPGSITISEERQAGTSLSLEPRGMLKAPVRSPVTISNSSEEKADVDVSVTGAQRTDIHGPVAGR